MARTELVICDECGRNAPAGVGDSPTGWLQLNPVSAKDRKAGYLINRHFCCASCTVTYLQRTFHLGDQLPLLTDNQTIIRIWHYAQQHADQQTDLVALLEALAALSRDLLTMEHQERWADCMAQDLIRLGAIVVNWLQHIFVAQERSHRQRTAEHAQD